MIDALRREKIRVKVRDEAQIGEQWRDRLSDAALRRRFQVRTGWINEVERLFLNNVDERVGDAETYWLNAAEQALNIHVTALHKMIVQISARGAAATAGVPVV